MSDSIYKYNKPSCLDTFTKVERRLILSYHNKGVDYKELAEIMGIEDAERIKRKANHMGVSLRKRKAK